MKLNYETRTFDESKSNIAIASFTTKSKKHYFEFKIKIIWKSAFSYKCSLNL